MKVLVTGATGFIGNYVIQELLSHGAKVVATSSNTAKAKEKSWYNEVNYIEHDIYKTSTENLFQKFNSPDVLIHLAWGNLSNFKSQDHVDIELPAHYLFLENLIKNGLKDLTCIGTCLEYGMQEGCLNEEMDSNPIIAYPIAKNSLRKKLEELTKSFQISLKWVRLFYMFGDGQSSKSILQLLDK
ncbi:MAG: NAD-dependent epimerase/dehydratase family protein, partial [Bacteroidota bacterium]